jgi:hypothetical protein
VLLVKVSQCISTCVLENVFDTDSWLISISINLFFPVNGQRVRGYTFEQTQEASGDRGCHDQSAQQPSGHR